MPVNDVIQKTEQLIRYLRELSTTSSNTETNLARLEGIVQQLGGLNLTNIRETSLLLANFNRELKAMGGESRQVRQIQTAFLELARTMEQVNTITAQFSAMAKMGVAKRGAAGVPLADADFLNAWKQQSDVYNQQKTAAAEARKALQESARIWQENLLYAQGIAQLRNLIIRQLYGGGGVPQLPAGPSTAPQVPQLPAGYRPLLTAGTPNTVTTPYSGEGNLPIHLYGTGAQNKYPAEPIDINAPTESPAARMRRLTTMIDGAVTQRVTEDVEEILIQSRETDASALTGGGIAKTIKRGGKELTGMWAEELPVSLKNLTEAGFSDSAAKNLQKTMEGLGMTSAQVMGNVTELSTGIQTVSFQMEGAGGAVKNFTTHLDRNGNVLVDTQKRFRSFGSAVMRDVVEVLKWTIAITAIYTPIRKLGELLDEMKKIQLDMVDVQIVLGDSTRQFATVLEASSQIATETSSSLEGVIEGYSLAAAAASSAGDETQRTVVTQTMLKDSMVLSKLANIDQKQALDTLVGSLSQLGMGLTQGTQLLDSWVAVSKKANVSVNQMATSFTIVGSAAQEAGVNYNELNALIGALAQSTNLSADELGNAIRGIISAMQTDKAQQSFAEYGIATKTVSGDFRDLMDILRQLKQMSEAGILDEKAMGALTQAGGAGARRGAQLSALVKNLDTVMNLVTVSESASGDAAEAMALEMDTLDAATTRLNNAFSELAITLGEEGGVLGFLTAVTNMITTLVKGVGSLTSALKTAAPILATFMLAKGIMGTQQGGALLNQNIPTKLASMFLPTSFMGTDASTLKPLTGMGKIGGFAPLSNWLLGLTQASGMGGTMMGGTLARTATMREFFGGMWSKINRPLLPERGIPNWSTAGNLPGGLNKMSLSTLLGPLLIAGSSLAAGGEGAGTKAAIGGGVGLLAGAITGSGMWATVGAMIATAFYDRFLTFEDDIATTWAAKMAEARENEPDEDTPEGALERLNREARASMSAWEIFKVNSTNWMMNTWSKLPWSTQEGKQVTPEETLLGLSIIGTGAVDEETRKIVLDAYNQLLRNQAKATEEMNVVSTSQQEEIARLAATASADIMNQAMEQIALGAQGSIQNFLDARTLAQKIGSTVTQLIDAQMLMMQEVTIGTGPTAKIITPAPAGFTPMSTQEAIKFVSELDDQSLGVIVSYYTEIKDLYAKIKVLNDQIAGQTGGVASESQQKDLDAYAARLAVLPGEFAQMLQNVQQGSVYTKLQEKFMPTISLPEMTPQQYQQVAEQAEKFWREYLKASGLTQAEIDLWIKNQDEQIVMMQNRVSPFRTNVPQEYFTPSMEEAGISGQMPGLIDWQQYTNQQFQQAKSMYPQFIQQIQRLLPTWKPEETDALYFLKDTASVEHLDNTIMQMLMRDLIDIEKDKGLQGLYNLPAGATFYVPVTAYELHRETQAGMASGGGGMSEANILALVEAALARTATTRLQESEQQFLQAQQAGVQNLQALPPGEGFEFAGQSYTMFGPPVPEGGALGYTMGNPLPVMVTNWTSKESEIYPEAETPADRVEREYRTTSQASIESSLPSWLQWTEEIGPTISKLSNFIGKLFESSNFDIGVPNPTSYAPTENTTMNTALNLAVDQKVTLTVDGRTLATIIKPYFYEDLIRFSASTTTSANRSVIA